MKIYTKRGDDGSTGLFGGPRVSKASLRVAAYGEVDELNSTLGVARAEFLGQNEFDVVLARVQSELFTLGAQLATPSVEKAPKGVPQLGESDVERLEQEIDAWDAELPPLKHFILPSGMRGAAALQLARAVCRRAERAVVLLSQSDEVPPLTLHYLNRLSDHLFTLARLVNHRSGCEETKWMPGEAESR